MSLGSRSCSRAKHKLRAALEKIHRQEMDTEVRTEKEVCPRCFGECDELVDGMCERCFLDDEDFLDDDSFADEDWCDRSDDAWDDYNGYDDMWDDYGYDDWYEPPPPIPGKFYRHRDGRLLLCCMIDDRNLFVDMLTGLEVRTNIWQVEVA